MREQHREVIRKEQDGLQNKEANESKTVETAIVTISVGDGLLNYLNLWSNAHY